MQIHSVTLVHCIQKPAQEIPTLVVCVCVHSPAMFEGPSGSGEVSQKQSDDGSSSEEEPGLGFFQPAESDDSDTEVR